MTPADIIRALSRRDVRVIAGSDGPVLDGTLGSITDDIAAAAKRCRWLFVWGLTGAGTGHTWHACDDCGQVQMLSRRSQPKRCTMTPSCQGFMHPLPDIFRSPAKPSVVAAGAASAQR